MKKIRFSANGKFPRGYKPKKLHDNRRFNWGIAIARFFSGGAAGIAAAQADCF